jgi:nitrite reductase (NO-forming)
MTTSHKFAIIFSAIIFFLLFGCTPQQEITVPVTPVENQSQSSATVNVEFTLKTIADGGKLLYIGVGGDIDGIVNPDLVVPSGAVVRITLIDGDGMTHDLILPDFNVKTEYVRRIGDQAELVFETGDMQAGSYVYYCTLPGHRKAGQEGSFIVKED